jgi:hypothetical protein
MAGIYPITQKQYSYHRKRHERFPGQRPSKNNPFNFNVLSTPPNGFSFRTGLEKAPGIDWMPFCYGTALILLHFLSPLNPYNYLATANPPPPSGL